MKKVNTIEKVYQAIIQLTIKNTKLINYSTIAKFVKKDPATAKYHVQRLIKNKMVSRDKKTGHITVK